MLTLNDGRIELWQWDTGRMLSVDADCSQVHFSNKVFGRSIDVDVVDGVAVIPDILLQTDKELTAWAFVGTAENGYTKISKVFKVNKRNKPADYVFTPQDQSTLGEILDRIEDLENRPSGDVSKEDIQNAVNDYLDKNPISVEETDPTVPAWAKQPEKPTYTAAEVGALPADTPIPEGGIPIPSSAQVGQTIVVKAVDEDGKPTEWETADLVSNVEYLQLVNVTTEQDVSDIKITECDDGVSFSDKNITEVAIRCEVAPNTKLTDYKDLVLIFKPDAPVYGYATLKQAMYNTKRYFVATLKAAGFIEAHYATFGDGTGKILFSANPYFMTMNFNKIEGIHLRSGDSVIPSGTKIIVMGR